MNAHQWYKYAVKVYDPKQDLTVTYKHIKGLTAAHATQQAKDGYTGLLGNYAEYQKQLIVTIIHKEAVTL